MNKISVPITISQISLKQINKIIGQFIFFIMLSLHQVIQKKTFVALKVDEF